MLSLLIRLGANREARKRGAGRRETFEFLPGAMSDMAGHLQGRGKASTERRRRGKRSTKRRRRGRGTGTGTGSIKGWRGGQRNYRSKLHHGPFSENR